MKLRHLFEHLGLRQKARSYGHHVEKMDVGPHGAVSFAQWHHPKYRDMRFEAAQVDLLRTIVSPGDGVIDIGTHTGNTTVLFALAVGDTGKVFGVEPNPYALEILHINAGLNPNIAPIEILPYAAVETPGRLTFNYSDAGFCNGGNLSWVSASRHNHLYKLEVEGRNIDSEIETGHPGWTDRIRLIKSDTEGNDAGALRSVSRIIRASRPYIVSEVYRHQTPEMRAELYRLLTDDFGYKIFRADIWRSLKGQELTNLESSDGRNFDIFCVPAEKSEPVTSP